MNIDIYISMSFIDRSLFFDEVFAKIFSKNKQKLRERERKKDKKGNISVKSLNQLNVVLYHVQ